MGREREEVILVEREPLVSGGACTEREIEEVLGAVEERTSVEEVWGR